MTRRSEYLPESACLRVCVLWWCRQCGAPQHCDIYWPPSGSGRHAPTLTVTLVQRAAEQSARRP